MKRRTLIVLLLLFVLACSGEKPSSGEAAPQPPPRPAPPDAQQAQELIARAPELGEYEFTNAGFTTPIAGASMSAPVRQSVRELAEAGWLAVDGAGDVTLTARSRSDKRFLLRSNGLLDIVPIAKKEMGTVQSVAVNADGTVSATFTWRWVPNEVGNAFRTGPVHDRFAAEQDGVATFIWDGTSWGILKIE